MGEKLQENNVPTHVGFIMDGNRRWAKAHGLEIALGHRKGSEALENMAEDCIKAGIKYTTFWGFSTENWSRETKEVDDLMALMVEKIISKADVLNKMGAQVHFVGRRAMFAEKMQEAMASLEELTAGNDTIVVNFAMSYGGKPEIVDAVREIIKKQTPAEKVTPDLLSECIYEAGQPDLDLIVRTGGERRLSGFMLWQSTYAELYFTNTLWPDFDGQELIKALNWYAEVKRNFGK